MGVLSYLGPFVLVSFFVAKDDPFVKFHIKQGLVLLVIEAGIWIIGSMMFMFGPLWLLLQLINLGTIILSIVGIIHVSQHKEVELPLVGTYAHYFHI